MGQLAIFFSSVVGQRKGPSRANVPPVYGIKKCLAYRERLLALDLLPLTYDREVRDLVYFFKSLFSYIDVNIDNYVSFVSHGRTRLSHTSRYILQSKLCKTNTFQSSYYNRVVKIWNTVCQEVSPDIFRNPNSFKDYLKHRYYYYIN